MGGELLQLHARKPLREDTTACQGRLTEEKILQISRAKESFLPSLNVSISQIFPRSTQFILFRFFFLFPTISSRLFPFVFSAFPCFFFFFRSTPLPYLSLSLSVFIFYRI